jgi:hypothetical protein
VFVLYNIECKEVKHYSKGQIRLLERDFRVLEKAKENPAINTYTKKLLVSLRK